ncbi:MAG: hypothetical protein LC731_01340, partial [Acidobacteria bacterium]|nr:hypothetical protein [Acidobacteriota bacterium]
DKYIYWRDPFLDQERRFYIESFIEYARVSRGIYDYSLSLREIRPYQPGTIEAVDAAFPYLPDYGSEVQMTREVFSSDAWDWSRVASALDGTTKERVKVVFSARGVAEFLVAENFWSYFYPWGKVTFPVAAALAGEYYIDSELSFSYAQHNMINYEFMVRRA